MQLHDMIMMTARSYFESMRWLHLSGKWDRDTPEKTMVAFKKTKARIT